MKLLNNLIYCRRKLIRFQLPSFEQKKVSMEKQLKLKEIQALIHEPSSIFEVLTSFFSHSSSELKEVAVEVYIRRAYRAYDIKNFKVKSLPRQLIAEWTYTSQS